MKKSNFYKSLFEQTHLLFHSWAYTFSVSCYVTVLQTKVKGFQRLLSQLEGTEELKYQRGYSKTNDVNKKSKDGRELKRLCYMKDYAGLFFFFPVSIR